MSLLQYFLFALFQLNALDLPLEQSYNTFNLIPFSTNYTETRTQVVLSLVASAFASPIDLTPEVAKATEEHLAAHAAATAGEHAALAPVQGAAIAVQGDAITVQGPSVYLDDAEDVAAAKAEFEKLFKAAEAGTPIVPALPALPVAPVAPVAPAVLPYGGYYGNYLGGYHGLGYNGYAGYPYGAYAGYNGAYAGYAGYPFGHLPYQLVAPAAKAE